MAGKHLSARERGVVLVTGGNSGIGFACARVLARAGYAVLLAGRNREASARAVERIARETGNGAVEALPLDLGSLAAVREFARELTARDLPLRALVCNAGLQLNRRAKSADGFELTFAVNHLGHFLLANLLLPRLRAHAPARVVVVSSGVHDPRLVTGMPKPAIANLETLAAGGARSDRFDGRQAYVNSKLCNLWFTYELVRRIEAAGLSSDAQPLSVNAFEPGLVPGSGLGRDYPPALRFVWERVLPPLARALSPVVASINSAERAGAALAHVVLDPALENASGRYFPSHSRFREAPSSDASYDAERARELWELSARLAGLQPGESLLASAAGARSEP